LNFPEIHFCHEQCFSNQVSGVDLQFDLSRTLRSAAPVKKAIPPCLCPQVLVVLRGNIISRRPLQLSTTVSTAWVLPETLAQIHLGPLVPYGDFCHTLLPSDTAWLEFPLSCLLIPSDMI
jgi:hypothetical protein